MSGDSVSWVVIFFVVGTIAAEDQAEEAQDLRSFDTPTISDFLLHARKQFVLHAGYVMAL